MTNSKGFVSKRGKINKDKRFDVIFTSDLIRAIDLAKLAYVSAG